MRVQARVPEPPVEARHNGDVGEVSRTAETPATDVPSSAYGNAQASCRSVERVFLIG
jgi:hypothetical protein